MNADIQAVRGMNDILPEQAGYWRLIEDTFRRLTQGYGYQEIRLPLVEKTDLFKRTIGEVTDIVEKEMYTFADRNGDSLTLRPEGTAGCVRAGIEHGLFHNQVQRWWYSGPMFRHERPQKGRYRQFYQLGIEAYGMAGPDIDAEIILLTARLWRELKIPVQLQINSLGSASARASYRSVLIDYFTANYQLLDDDSRRRLQTNPLRILDSKNPELRELNESAPQLLDHLDEESRIHFDKLRSLLDTAGVPYVINPRLVRGLDYYNRTVFEWVTDQLGSQGTVCAGGRYDGLVEQLGGKATPAIGFALGVERLVGLLELQQPAAGFQAVPDCYLIAMGDAAKSALLPLAEQLRDQVPTVTVWTDCAGGSVKSQLKRADKSGARAALLIGDDEMRDETVTVKYLREEQAQSTIKQQQLAQFLRTHLAHLS